MLSKTLLTVENNIQEGVIRDGDNTFFICMALRVRTLIFENAHERVEKNAELETKGSVTGTWALRNKTI